ILYHSEGTAGFAKQTKHQGHRAAHFFVGVRDDMTILVVAQSHGQWKSQFSFLRFVEFTAHEARADEVQLRLRHRALESQQYTSVEVRRIVAPHLLDHWCAPQRT